MKVTFQRLSRIGIRLSCIITTSQQWLSSLSMALLKNAMREKVEEKLLKVARISRLEKTNMTEQKGKWLVVTNKACKAQVKREVERILKGVTLQIMHPTYTQPGTIAKEYRDPTLVTYAATLQAAAENGPEITKKKN